MRRSFARLNFRLDWYRNVDRSVRVQSWSRNRRDYQALCFTDRDVRWATGTCVREARFSKEGRIFQRVATSLRVIPGSTRAVMRGRGR